MNNIIDYIDEIYPFFIKLGNYLENIFMVIIKNPLYFSISVLVINLILLLFIFRNNRKLIKNTIKDTFSISFSNEYNYEILFSKRELLKIIKLLTKAKSSCFAKIKLKDKYKKSNIIQLDFSNNIIKINNKYLHIKNSRLSEKFFMVLKKANSKDVFMYDDTTFIIRINENKYYLIRLNAYNDNELRIDTFNVKDVNYIHGTDCKNYIYIKFEDSITNYRFEKNNICNNNLARFLNVDIR